MAPTLTICSRSDFSEALARSGSLRSAAVVAAPVRMPSSSIASV
jgi:hypothetical protein